MSAFWNNTYLTSVPEVLKIMNGHVVFGAPSRKCAGSGICKLYSFHATNRLNIPCAIVPVQLVLTTTQLCLCILQENCTAVMTRQFFSGTHFTMEEEFHLPSWMIRSHKKKYMYVPTGNYPFQCEGGYYWIKLVLLTN